MATPWHVVHNWAADLEGSIHHDETARSKGFPAGLLPGDVHVVLVTAAVVDRFGSPWYERGWIRQTFVAPAFNGEELRVVLEEQALLDGDDGVVDFLLERRGGDVVCAGSAGVYRPGTEPVAPWDRPDAPPPRETGSGDPLPHEPVGTWYEERTPHPEIGDFDRSLDGNDDNPWYRESSPWGDPVMPAVGPFSLAHRIRPTPAPDDLAREMRSGMNAGWEALHTGPLPYGRRWLRRAQLVAKGTKGRYGWRTVEFTLADPEEDRPRFTGRWRTTWVRSQTSASST